MKYTKIGVVLLFTFLMFFNMFVIENSVKGDTVDVTLAGFDDVASGVSNSVSNYINFTKVGGTGDFQTANTNFLSTPNSFKVECTANEDIQGYWNLTTSFNYIGVINMSFIGETTTSNGDISIKFNDSDGNTVIHIRFDYGDDLDWYSVGVGWQEVYGSCANSRLYLIIRHLTTNQFNISVLDSSFSPVGSIESSGSYAGNFTSFSTIYFDVSAGGTDIADVYFDNIKINILRSIDDYFTIWLVFKDTYTGYTLLYYPVDPTQDDEYDVYSNYIFGNIYYTNDQDNTYLLASPYITWDNGPLACRVFGVSGDSFNLSVTGLYSEDISGYVTPSHDGSPQCFEHYWENVPLRDGEVYYLWLTRCGDVLGQPNATILTDHISVFGNEFIQFWNYDQHCEYRVGDKPIIIYNLSDDNFSATDDGYLYEIVNINSNYLMYQGIIDFATDYQSLVFRIEDLFTTSGDYVINLYNINRSNFSLKNNFVMKSLPIYVCSESRTGPDEVDDPIIESDTDYGQYIAIASFIGLLGISAIICKYVGDWKAFPFSLFGGIMLLSLPGTFLFIFPTVFLFIAGLILCLLIVVLFVRR